MNHRVCFRDEQAINISCNLASQNIELIPQKIYVNMSKDKLIRIFRLLSKTTLSDKRSACSGLNSYSISFTSILIGHLHHCSSFSFSTTTVLKVSVFGVIRVCILPHSDRIWIDTPYLSVFSPNAGKCGPE